MNKLIDTHIHLDDARYSDVDSIVSDFSQDEILLVINNSCDLDTMTSGHELSQKHKQIYCTIGTHPHEAKHHDKAMELKMLELSQSPKVVAVGEIGLDYYYDHSERQVQREVFVRQLEMAHSFGLPVTLHLRDCWQDAIDIIKNNKHLFKNSGVMHCFTGSAELARMFCDMGFYIAFNGVITFANAKKDDVIRAVPIERILSETDAPYLTPVPHRGKLNYPSYVRYVVSKLAEVYQVDEDKLRAQIIENTKNCFPKIVI